MNRYLLRHAFCAPLIEGVPASDLELVVVIPVYAEENLNETLSALCHCTKPNGSAECIVVINASEQDSSAVREINSATVRRLELLRHDLPEWLMLHVVVNEELPRKKAGVGLARKIGMDEAVRRFDQVDKDGIIVSLDADCTCDPKYLESIQRFFYSNPAIWSGCLDFHHPIINLAEEFRKAIVDYELHLRYFIGAQRFIGLPFAFQTVGSCMAVRCSAYQKRGGMNSRKAGEDFYFIHKFTSINRHQNIPGARVYPSARCSSRVPFGTGRAIANHLESRIQYTSAWQSFIDLKSMVDTHTMLMHDPVDTIRIWPIPLQQYFKRIEGEVVIKKLIRDTKSLNTFRSRFFQWFDAFQLMKYVHFCRNHYADQPVLEEARKLAGQLVSDGAIIGDNAWELLTWFRCQDENRINAEQV